MMGIPALEAPRIKLGQRRVQYRCTRLPEEWRAIVEEELTRYQVSERDLIEGKRWKRFVEVRNLIWMRLNRELGVTGRRLAIVFGYDHTTVYHSLNRRSCTRGRTTLYGGSLATKRQKERAAWKAI